MADYEPDPALIDALAEVAALDADEAEGYTQ